VPSIVVVKLLRTDTTLDLSQKARVVRRQRPTPASRTSEQINPRGLDHVFLRKSSCVLVVASYVVVVYLVAGVDDDDDQERKGLTNLKIASNAN
jgi:hypothetical protein